MKIAAASVELLRHMAAPGWRSKAVFHFIHAMFRVIRPRRKVALDNIAQAFPEKPRDWHKETLKGMYAHLSWVIVEMLVLQRDPSMVVKWVDEIEGEERLSEALNQKRGLVLASAHFGNWELGMAWAPQRGYPLCTIARGPSDPDLDKLLARYRENWGLKAFDRRLGSTSILKLAKLLKSGNFMAIAGDVHSYEGIDLPFFGRTCKTPTGAASFALLADVQLLPLSLFRKAPFSHKLVVGPPIKIPPAGTRKERIEAATREINQYIENAIRQDPSRWLWTHRRWK